MKTLIKQSLLKIKYLPAALVTLVFVSSLLVLSTAQAFDPKDNSGLTGFKQNNDASKLSGAKLPNQTSDKTQPICICGCDGKTYTCNPAGCGALEGVACGGGGGNCAGDASCSAADSFDKDKLINPRPEISNPGLSPGDNLKPEKAFPGDQFNRKTPQPSGG